MVWSVLAHFGRFCRSAIRLGLQHVARETRTVPAAPAILRPAAPRRERLCCRTLRDPQGEPWRDGYVSLAASRPLILQSRATTCGIRRRAPAPVTDRGCSARGRGLQVASLSGRQAGARRIFCACLVPRFRPSNQARNRRFCNCSSGLQFARPLPGLTDRRASSGTGLRWGRSVAGPSSSTGSDLPGCLGSSRIGRSHASGSVIVPV